MQALFTLVVLLLLTQSVDAATYYVDKAGSDGNSCATASAAASNRSLAKLTINSGENCGSSPGDIVIIGNGTYVEANVSMNSSGTAGNYITLKAENKWLAILSSTSTNQCQPAIYVNGSYTKIDGLAFRVESGSGWCAADSTTGDAIRAFNGPVGLWVTNIHVDDPVDGSSRRYRSHGVKSNQDGTIIENSYILAGVETLNADNAIIRGNVIGTGVELRCGGNWNNAIVTKGGGHNVIVERNSIDCPSMAGSGIILGGANASDSPVQECFDCVARNNIVKVPTNQKALNFQGCLNCSFSNNTAVGGTTGTDLAPSSSNINNSLRNNIISTSGSCTSGTSGSTHNYNNFFGCSGAPSQVNAFSADPLFVNAASGNYALQAGSSMIDAGVNVGLPFNGSLPDLGAHETLVSTSCSVEAGDASTLRITFANNVYPPLLPASPAFGTNAFTARKAGSNNTVTGASRVGDNQIYLTLTNAIAGGDAVDYSYSTTSGNVTDSALIGGTNNQRLNAITNQSCTNNVGAGDTSVLTQTVAKFFGLRGPEDAPIATPHPGAAENTNVLIIPNGSVRLRLGISCTGADCPPVGFFLRYSLNGGSYTVVPDAFDSDNIAFCGTGSLQDVPTSGVATTQQLSGSGTYTPGALVRASNAIPTIDMVQNGRSEVEYCIRLDSDVTPGAFYNFRVYKQDGSALDGYTVTPRATVMAVQAGMGF